MSETLKFSDAINIDIPWADPMNPKHIPEGTEAVVPEISMYGELTGNNVHLTHEEYMHELGGAALTKADIAAGIDSPINVPHPIISTKGHIVPGAPPPLETYHGQDLPDTEYASEQQDIEILSSEPRTREWMGLTFASQEELDKSLSGLQKNLDEVTRRERAALVDMHKNPRLY